MKDTVTFPARGGMSFMQRAVLDKFYSDAEGDPTRLPWHRDEADPLLEHVLEQRPAGRALDVGCGAGVLSQHLAARGHAVTAVDLHGHAVAMARERAARGPAFEVLQADVLAYRPAEPFDVVLDSGCLHTLGRDGLRVYRERLLDWLAPGGDFVLEHWDRRHRLDWRPVGPRRRTCAEIVAVFTPELRLVEARSADFEVPLPLGPHVRGTAYHFRRSA